MKRKAKGAVVSPDGSPNAPLVSPAGGDTPTAGPSNHSGQSAVESSSSPGAAREPLSAGGPLSDPSAANAEQSNYTPRSRRKRATAVPEALSNAPNTPDVATASEHQTGSSAQTAGALKVKPKPKPVRRRKVEHRPAETPVIHAATVVATHGASRSVVLESDLTSGEGACRLPKRGHDRPRKRREHAEPGQDNEGAEPKCRRLAGDAEMHSGNREHATTSQADLQSDRTADPDHSADLRRSTRRKTALDAKTPSRTQEPQFSNHVGVSTAQVQDDTIGEKECQDVRDSRRAMDIAQPRRARGRSRGEKVPPQEPIRRSARRRSQLQ